jgi:hypothetical protein
VLSFLWILPGPVYARCCFGTVTPAGKLRTLSHSFAASDDDVCRGTMIIPGKRASSENRSLARTDVNGADFARRVELVKILSASGFADFNHARLMSLNRVLFSVFKRDFVTAQCRGHKRCKHITAVLPTDLIRCLRCSIVSGFTVVIRSGVRQQQLS